MSSLTKSQNCDLWLKDSRYTSGFTENSGTEWKRALALLKGIPKSKVKESASLGLGEMVGKISAHFEPVYGCEKRLSWLLCTVLFPTLSPLLPNLNLLLPNLSLKLPNPGPICYVGASKQIGTIVCPVKGNLICYGLLSPWPWIMKNLGLTNVDLLLWTFWIEPSVQVRPRPFLFRGQVRPWNLSPSGFLLRAQSTKCGLINQEFWLGSWHCFKTVLTMTGLRWVLIIYISWIRLCYE